MAVKKPTKGFAQKPKPAGPKPKTPAQIRAAQLAEESRNNAKATYQSDLAKFNAGSLTAHLTDPTYQQERADLDLALNNARNDFATAMGSGTDKGQIWNDYDYAVNALTRGNRKNIGQTNAGLSGSNLAGSGIARKQLSDIAAEFFSDKGKMDTDRERAEASATQRWKDSEARFNASDLAGIKGAEFRWSQMNDAPEAPKPQAVAPPGKQYVKNPNGQGWTLKPKPAAKPTKPAAKPVQGVGTVKPGTKAPVGMGVKAPPGTKFVKQPNGKFKAVRV